MAPEQAILSLHQQIQQECLPGLWSKGVSFTRENAVLEESISDDEYQFRILVRDKPVSPKVSLWPDEQDWFCDCGHKAGPCAHVAAAIIALKTNNFVRKNSQSQDSPNTSNINNAAKSASILYAFSKREQSLVFERFIVTGTSNRRTLEDSLVSFIGGQRVGRIEGPPVAASKEDFAVDTALGTKKRGVLDIQTLERLFSVLENVSGIEFEGRPIRVSSKPSLIELELLDANNGFLLRPLETAPIQERFTNGAVLVGEVLKLRNEPTFTQEEKNWISNTNGSFFPTSQAEKLVIEILPRLQKKTLIKIVTTKLPTLENISPHIILRMQKLTDTVLTVVPQIVYGTPPQAEVLGDEFKIRQDRTNPAKLPKRDLQAERNLIRKLQSELHLSPGQLVRYEKQRALEFVKSTNHWDSEGDGKTAFSLGETLSANFVFENGDFDLRFSSGGKANLGGSDSVFQAWKTGDNFIPLLGGGWAQLPKDWLDKYGPRLHALFEAKAKYSKIPSHYLPTIAQICEETYQTYPESLKLLRNRLEDFTGIPQATVPKDFKGQLRSYQQKGIDWLHFLRDVEMGALLADDMGLGKTLQALCSVSGKTLAVVPTSVLSAWLKQAENFRPALRVSLYYGASRKLDQNADLIVTSYGVLRSDVDFLTSIDWDTVIIDEAQTIKNPESQVAKAAHRLRGKFRIALSGTPIENRITDLWSQMQFLNPGLLRTKEEFEAEFRKNPNVIRAQIKPFVLRRLKKEVAPELPPRTELTLHCELSDSEKTLYDSLLAATQNEVLEKLKQGESVFHALEALLRLRQASCHPALVPGQTASSSSKLELLLESLEESLDLGHKALVFSQWTSFLDLIEPKLTEKNFKFLRLDGSTTNRAAIVEEFQSRQGPPILLLSLKAGGVGLTLTAADHIYLMDPWWNPAVEDQAADRAHRIGQENPVFIHRLVAKNTIEDRILALQERKLELARLALGETSGQTTGSLQLTREDLLSLLS